MSKWIYRTFVMLVLQFAIILLTSTTITLASSVSEISTIDIDSQKYYLGTVVNTGKDNGYSEQDPIGIEDPHYGWVIGKFFVSGYSRVSEDDSGNIVFLKNVGDKVTLWFNLEQDIDSLNENPDLTVNEDTNGYDEYFNTVKANYERGVLIIRHTNYENKLGDPVIYTNYLSAKVTKGADTKVELFEEGDYEVSLDYEIKNSPRKIIGKDILPSYTNYKIFFKFIVRNGNCMVFPFDVETKSELSNTAITEHGFYLDLAKSRYLDINIVKEILKDGADGLTEDVRFNKPAKDGEKYIDEGIYTITAINRYTEQKTIKKIYVGENKILKAHFTTGLSFSEIRSRLAQGSVIADDGSIVKPVSVSTIISQSGETDITSYFEGIWIFVIGGATLLIAVIIMVPIVIARKKHRNGG